MPLTDTEQEAVERARSLLERTRYDETDEAPERVTDARSVAYALLELAAALMAERSARVAIQERAEGLQAILGKAAYEAMT